MTVALRWWWFRKCEVLCRTGANRFNTTSPQTDTLSHALTTGRVTQKTFYNPQWWLHHNRRCGLAQYCATRQTIVSWICSYSFQPNRKV